MTLWSFPGEKGYVYEVCGQDTRKSCLHFLAPISGLLFLWLLYMCKKNVWDRSEKDSLGRRKPGIPGLFSLSWYTDKLPDILKAALVSVMVGDVTSDILADFGDFPPFDSRAYHGTFTGTWMMLTSVGLPIFVLGFVTVFTLNSSDYMYVINNYAFPQNAREKIDTISDFYSALLSVLSVVVYIWATYATGVFQVNTLRPLGQEPLVNETDAAFIGEMLQGGGCAVSQGSIQDGVFKPDTTAYTVNLCLLMALRVDYLIRFVITADAQFFFDTHNLLDFLSISDIFAWVLGFQFKEYTHSFGFLRYPRVMKVTRLGFVREQMGATWHKLVSAILVIVGVLFMFGGLILTVEFPCRMQTQRQSETALSVFVQQMIDVVFGPTDDDFGDQRLLNVDYNHQLDPPLNHTDGATYNYTHTRGQVVFSDCPVEDFWGVYCLHTAIYFASITLTTIGYGDYSPVSGEGQLLAMVCSILGIALISTFTGTLIQAVMELSPINGKYKPTSDHQHVILVVLGNQRASAITQFVTEFFSFNNKNYKRKVVILMDKSPDESLKRKLEVHGELAVVLKVQSMTDPVDMAVAFKRAGLYDISCQCIFLSSDEHSDTPTEDDYLTLLWTMAIRKNLTRQKFIQNKTPPIVAMVIEKEAKKSVIAAGANTVLCAREMKCNIFANGLRTMGYIPLFTNLLHSNSQNCIKQATKLERSLRRLRTKGRVCSGCSPYEDPRDAPGYVYPYAAGMVGWDLLYDTDTQFELHNQLCLSPNAVEVAEYIRGSVNCIIDAPLTKTHLSMPHKNPKGKNKSPSQRASDPHFSDVTDDGAKLEGRRFCDLVALLKLLPTAAYAETEAGQALKRKLPHGLRALPNVLLIGVRSGVQERDVTRLKESEYDPDFFKKQSGTVMLNPGDNYIIQPGDNGVFISCNLEERLYTMRCDDWLSEYLQQVADIFPAFGKEQMTPTPSSPGEGEAMLPRTVDGTLPPSTNPVAGGSDAGADKAVVQKAGESKDVVDEAGSGEEPETAKGGKQQHETRAKHETGQKATPVAALMCGSMHSMIEILEVECIADCTRNIMIIHPDVPDSQDLDTIAAQLGQRNSSLERPNLEILRLAKLKMQMVNFESTRGSPLVVDDLVRAGIEQCTTVLVLTKTTSEERSQREERQGGVESDMDNVKIIQLILQQWEGKHDIITELSHPTSLVSGCREE
jgi:hypothetical protein